MRRTICTGQPLAGVCPVLDGVPHPALGPVLTVPAAWSGIAARPGHDDLPDRVRDDLVVDDEDDEDEPDPAAEESVTPAATAPAEPDRPEDTDPDGGELAEDDPRREVLQPA